VSFGLTEWGLSVWGTDSSLYLESAAALTDQTQMVALLLIIPVTIACFRNRTSIPLNYRKSAPIGALNTYFILQ